MKTYDNNTHGKIWLYINKSPHLVRQTQQESTMEGKNSFKKKEKQKCKHKRNLSEADAAAELYKLIWNTISILV